MKTHAFKIALACVLLIAAIACKKQKEVREDYPEYIALNVPPGFTMPKVPSDNRTSREGVALGRRLYYDTLLSYGGPHSGKSCSSCHFQSYGFTVPDQPVLPHVNLAWANNFLWNGSVEGTLEDAMRFEVNSFFAGDLSKIAASPEYRSMYKSAFGSEEVNTENSAKALAQFIRTLISGNSRYDLYLRGTEVLTQEEKDGMAVFFSEKGDCFHCHAGALFTDNAFHNNGLVPRSQADMGRYLITGNSADVGRFKTPTLRNTALRGRYMHDGRYTTLAEVMDHYNSGLHKSEYLDPLLDANDIDLSDAERSALIAFLKTLTDIKFINNPDFSKPK